jgi:S-DNA-T family DNA segregation ATPase FtsK/SpoIIIE
MGKDAESKSRSGEYQPAWRRFLRYCFVLMVLGTTALAWLAVLSFNPDDPPAGRVFPPPPVHNTGGIVGSHLAYLLLYWIGDGSYMLLLFLSACAAVMTFGGRIGELPWRLTGLSLMVTATSAASHLLAPASPHGFMEGNGGILGIAVGNFLLERFATAGSWLVLLVGFGIAVMLTADNLVLRLPGISKKVWQHGAARALKAVAQVIPSGKGAGVLTLPPSRLSPHVLPKPKPEKDGTKDADQVSSDDESKETLKGKPALDKTKTQEDQTKDRQKQKDQDSQVPQTGAGEPPKAVQVQLPFKPLTVAPKPAKPARPPMTRRGQYQLPSLDLLAEPSGGYREGQEALAEEKRAVLQQTLDNFGVEAQVVGHMTGPVISQFELSLSPGVKVSHVQTLAPDIARSLAVPGVRVVSPLPGRDTMGIEVPNMDKEMVRLKDLMNLSPESAEKMQLPLYLGKDAAGGPIVADLAGMPHLLMAGTTGSGKSVCINAIIASLLLTRSPDDVRFILVDPKMVEMAAYESIPHLLCPIVNDMRKAEDILEWAATKMDERYELLKEGGVRNIVGYNNLSPEQLYQRFDAQSEEDKAQIPTHMPYYVIIIDELADLIMTSSKEVEGHIIRIAQKARAVGIHLILATQRPSVNVVTGLIKSNMPCRVSFRVASRQESRIVLDQNGADVLLGQGDMLFLQPGTSHLIRAQGTFVDEKEVRSLTEHVKSIAQPDYCQELLKLQSGLDPEQADGEKDPLFDEAVEIVLASQRGSVSLLQRRLQVGYSRASRIVDQMAEAGILGDYKGSQARECLLTLEDWQALKSKIADDQSGASAADSEPTSC